MSTCRRRTIQFSKIAECQAAASTLQLTSGSSSDSRSTSGLLRCWISLFNAKSRTQHPRFNINALPSIEKKETALLAYSKADFLLVKEFKTGGKFLVAWTRRASNPYPKVFFVLTSVCVTRNDEEGFAPTFILAINNPTENYVRTQAVFLATISFSSGPFRRSAHSSTHDITVQILAQ
jgi:hypothetical protein